MEIKTNLVTIQTVTEALRAIRFAKPLGYRHPISALFQLGKKIQVPQYVDADVYTDIQIYCQLASLLRLRLNRQRRLYALGLVSQYAPVIDVFQSVTEDFQQNNTILEAWSTIYHLYGRSDLDISIEKLSVRINQTKRTLQRRQSLGVALFTQYLLRYELRIRIKQD